MDTVRISQNAPEILDDTFRDCPALRTVVFEPESQVTRIGNFAFGMCVPNQRKIPAQYPHKITAFRIEQSSIFS
ncbi:MAG: hypothetical protein LBF84_01770 [Holosporales bacterium]|nr:hypothetical protein [Holosporales bacterium]